LRLRTNLSEHGPQAARSGSARRWSLSENYVLRTLGILVRIQMTRLYGLVILRVMLPPDSGSNDTRGMMGEARRVWRPDLFKGVDDGANDGGRHGSGGG
jgi:hypothetical protein